MPLPKALLAVALALCAAATACGDGGTPPNDDGQLEPDIFAGRWVLLTINGEPLPATEHIFNRRIQGGLLDIATVGGAGFGYCFDTLGTQFGGGLGATIYDLDLDDGLAELWAFLTQQTPPVDTIRVAQDTLTWEYNLRAEPGGTVTDIFRFRRLAPLEPRPCT